MHKEKGCDSFYRRSWESGARMIGTGSEARVAVTDLTARPGFMRRYFYQSLGCPVVSPSLQKVLPYVKSLYGEWHAKSCKALVVALTLHSEGRPIVEDPRIISWERKG